MIRTCELARRLESLSTDLTKNAESARYHPQTFFPSTPEKVYLLRVFLNTGHAPQSYATCHVHRTCICQGLPLSGTQLEVKCFRVLFFVGRQRDQEIITQIVRRVVTIQSRDAFAVFIADMKPVSVRFATKRFVWLKITTSAANIITHPQGNRWKYSLPKTNKNH